MPDRNGIEIDYCTECRGVWLDPGELDKISLWSMLQQDKRYPGNNNHGKYYYIRDNDYRYKK